MKILGCEYDQWDEAAKKAKSKRKCKARPSYKTAVAFKNYYAK